MDRQEGRIQAPLWHLLRIRIKISIICTQFIAAQIAMSLHSLHCNVCSTDNNSPIWSLVVPSSQNRANLRSLNYLLVLAQLARSPWPNSWLDALVGHGSMGRKMPGSCLKTMIVSSGWSAPPSSSLVVSQICSDDGFAYLHNRGSENCGQQSLSQNIQPAHPLNGPGNDSR